MSKLLFTCTVIAQKIKGISCTCNYTANTITLNTRGCIGYGITCTMAGSYTMAWLIIAC